ncbi:MAG: PucC family protein, partial [Pseudomonadota bacterium]
TLLTALLAGGTLLGFAAAARGLARGGDPYRLAALGALAGVPGFSMVVFAAPLESAMLFRAGAAVIGFGGGLFSVGTLTAAMALSRGEGGGSADAGLALGAWGAVQATAAGAGILLGGILRDAVAALSASGALGEALSEPAVAYSVVYHLEILLLFFTLIVIGPLARFAGRRDRRADGRRERFGLAEFPG